MSKKSFIIRTVTVLLFLIAAIKAVSVYMTVDVDLESDKYSLSELYYSDIPTFQDNKFIKEMLSPGENFQSFPVRKSKYYRYKVSTENDAKIRITRLCIRSLFTRAVFTEEDIKNFNGSGYHFDKNGVIVSEKGGPVISFGYDIIRKRSGFCFSGELVLFVLLVLLVSAGIYWFTPEKVRTLSEKYPFIRTPRFGYLLWGIFFILLVSVGITGSSIGMIRLFNTVSCPGERLLFADYQMIRTDEYIAHGTAAAIINTKHTPEFPLINTNVGISGRNMLFLHDWGAPVKHPAVLLKPATWAFFFMDLRRALSFYWLLPIFLGTFALSFLLDTLFPENKSRWHFLIALAVTFSSYNVVWSFWPLNCAWGSMLFTALLIRALRNADRSKGKALIISAAAGWCLAAAGATLYFPHIYPVLLLCIAILVYKISAEKLWKKNKLFFAVLTAVSLLTAGGLLFLYLYSIRDALAIALSSVYPGKRLLTGGGLAFSELFKFNFMFFNYETPLAGSVCDAQRIQLLFPVLAIIFFIRRKLLKDVKLAVLLMLFIAACLWFQFIGIPAFLAKITLMNRVLEQRTCFAMVIAQMILAVSLLNIKSEKSMWQEIKTFDAKKIFFSFAVGCICTLFCTAMFMDSFDSLPFLFSSKRVFFYFALDIAFIFLYTFLLMYQLKAGILFFTVISVAENLLFNPVCIAPTDITSPLQKYVENAKDKKHDGRVLFINPWMSDTASIQSAYAMSGGKTYSGFFCYEDMEIFNKLMAHLPDAEQFHRLNHLSCWLTDVPHCPEMNAMVIQKDVIRVYFNARNYDFSKLEADFLCVPYGHYSKQLAENPSLKEEQHMGFWQLYRICRKQKNT